MARLNSSESGRLERYEGTLGCLGSALVLMELVEVRVGLAVGSMPGLLQPAMDDLQRARGLVRQGQVLASMQPCAYPIPAPTEVENAAV